jgi:hypothetical protein
MFDAEDYEGEDPLGVMERNAHSCWDGKKEKSESSDIELRPWEKPRNEKTLDQFI